MSNKILKLAEQFERIYNLTKKSQAQPVQKYVTPEVKKIISDKFSDIKGSLKDIVDALQKPNVKIYKDKIINYLNSVSKYYDEQIPNTEAEVANSIVFSEKLEGFLKENFGKIPSDRIPNELRVFFNYTLGYIDDLIDYLTHAKNVPGTYVQLSETTVSKNIRPYYDILRKGNELVDRVSLLHSEADEKRLEQLDPNVKELIRQITEFNTKFPYSDEMPNEAKTMSKRLNALLEKAKGARRRTNPLPEWGSF